jgi:hypothetical protein
VKTVLNRFFWQFSTVQCRAMQTANFPPNEIKKGKLRPENFPAQNIFSENKICSS